MTEGRGDVSAEAQDLDAGYLEPLSQRYAGGECEHAKRAAAEERLKNEAPGENDVGDSNARKTHRFLEAGLPLLT